MNIDDQIILAIKVATDPNAVKVKLADIQHNLSSNPSERSKLKYAQAKELFQTLGYSS